MVNKEFSLEIGVGINPMISHLRQDLLPRRGILLLNDIEIRELKELEELYRNLKIGVPFQADAHRLPFPDSSLSLILAKDLIGFPGHFSIRSPNLLSPSNIDLRKLSLECYRVLRKNGKLVIVEVSTPPELEGVINIFKKSGLELVEKNQGKENTFNVFDFGFGVKVNTYYDSYSLVFNKTA